MAAAELPGEPCWRMTAHMMFRVVPLVWLLLAPAPVLAAGSDWLAVEGARIRLVTEDAAGADGRLRGALVIELQPGWKTYWKDPGDAGIAPQIDVSAGMNVEGAEIGFPAPARFGEGADVWAGYSGPLALPITFSLADPKAFTSVDAEVFLGVCRDICVPVQARFSVLPSGDGSTREQEVQRAFDALPAPASDVFGVVSAKEDETSLRLEAILPEGVADPELFVASPPGWVLRAPVVATNGTATVFVVPVADRPETALPQTRLDYTLVAGERSVHGVVDLRSR